MADHLTFGKAFARSALISTLALSMIGCHWVDLASQSTEGIQGNNDSFSIALSSDGHYAVFASKASNLVANDTNSRSDVFLRDNQLGTVTRISVSSTGEQGNGESEAPKVSADGRQVVYYSWASNLVEGDNNNTKDVFVFDAQTETTTRVSVSSDGTEGNSWSLWPDIAANGRHVTFLSSATNLVPGYSSGAQQIFIHDRDTGATNKISVNNAGEEANQRCWSPNISADGRHIAFATEANNLVPGDTNGKSDIFLRDTLTGTTTRVSVDSTGKQGNDHSRYPVISANGRYIAFHSQANNLVAGDTNRNQDVFVHDAYTGTTTRVNVDTDGNQSTQGAEAPSLSADGRYVAFESRANDLVEADTSFYSDIFVHDRQTGTTLRASLSATDVEADSHSYSAALSGDGRYIGFSTEASNLTPDDSNSHQDVIIRAVPVVTIDNLAPDYLPIGATTSVTITGSGFLANAIPWFNQGHLTNIVVVDENTITADFTIPPDKSSGAYTMGINLFGTGPGQFTGVAAKCIDCVILF